MDGNIEIKLLRDEFLSEALGAPKLFHDLAKVEKYIAESYKSRSIIELIQNADDSGSRTFGIHQVDSFVIIGNDGRIFNQTDLESLCRSGSSNKFRGGSTIGYRGIGFKSVVNLAKTIFINSGSYEFCFDKEKTSKLIPVSIDVPIIRIPHETPNDINSDLRKIGNHLKDRYGYNTLFYFLGVNQGNLMEEMRIFERSSLIFLRNISAFHCNINSLSREITLERYSGKHDQIVKITEVDREDIWKIFNSKADHRDIVAFKSENNEIVSASPSESVVHSFTPTREFAGLYAKINGDYSTDPSRKNVDIDEHSTRAFANAIQIISDKIVDILENNECFKGFFKPFIDIKSEDSNYFRKNLLQSIAKSLNCRTFKIKDRKIQISQFRLRPDWLNFDDYENLCSVDLCPIDKMMASAYPELPLFFENIGIKKLSLREVADRINNISISVIGLAQIASKLIKQYRFDMNDENVAWLRELNILSVNYSGISATNIDNVSKLDQPFIDYILESNDKDELKTFFSKIGIDGFENLMLRCAEDNKQHYELNTRPKVAENIKEQQTKFQIQRWRSAEKNTAEYIKSLPEVMTVKDVSEANLGYDIEVILKNGHKMYIEVKCVKNIGERIKITNNEYSCAHSYGDDYYIAIFVQNDISSMFLIKNPISNIKFQKQVERWSWFCEDYMHVLCHPEETLKG